MKKQILKLIKEIEKQEKIKVLFAIESGSRAWKWESKDSDYDVRGVFTQDYLKIDNIKDQITKIEGDLDIVLWDLQKFLRLMINSNPSTWEWLSSDIVYLDNSIRNKLKKIFEKDFSKYALKKHYISMARQNFEKYIRNSQKVNLKKYVYVLRSIACVLWIEKYNIPPPKDYRKVIVVLPKEIKEFFEKIVKNKQESESLEGEKNKRVDEYVISYFKREFKKEDSSFDLNKMNKIFKEAIK